MVIRTNYGGDVANKPLSLRLSQQTIDAMDKICKVEGTKGRAALVEMFVRDYRHYGLITKRLDNHEQRIETLETHQSAQG